MIWSQQIYSFDIKGTCEALKPKVGNKSSTRLPTVMCMQLKLNAWYLGVTRELSSALAVKIVKKKKEKKTLKKAYVMRMFRNLICSRGQS